jgi:hypothetical protein
MHDRTQLVAVAVACLSTFGLPTSSAARQPTVIEASEFALKAPARLDTGSSQFQLRNAGLLDHHVRVLRLDSGRSFREFERALVANGAVPSWAIDVGGFASTTGGAAGTTTLRLSAGVHVLICIGSLTDGSAMAMKGMYRSIDVHMPSQQTPNRNH